LPYSEAGKEHYIFIGNLKNKTKIAVKEDKRDSQIIADFAAVIRKSDDQKFIGANSCIKYVQSYERATVEVKATITVDKSDKKVSGTFIAGPEENLYLSFDMPVTDVKQLSFDSGSIVEKEKPSSFYLGLNWQIGDIFTDYDKKKDFYKKISLKAMFSIGESLNDSRGFGLSYEFKYADIFVAKVRTKSDDSNLDEKESTIYGISFPIGKRMSWLN
jgi:hypothetical protein